MSNILIITFMLLHLFIFFLYAVLLHELKEIKKILLHHDNRVELSKLMEPFQNMGTKSCKNCHWYDSNSCVLRCIKTADKNICGEWKLFSRQEKEKNKNHSTTKTDTPTD
jgi:hypothetical protein